MLAALQAELNAFKAAFEAVHGRAPDRSDLRPVRMKLALYSKATRELRARADGGDDGLADRSRRASWLGRATNNKPPRAALTALDLAGNGIGDDGLLPLLDALACNERLQQLDLRDNPIQQKALALEPSVALLGGGAAVKPRVLLQ